MTGGSLPRSMRRLSGNKSGNPPNTNIKLRHNRVLDLDFGPRLGYKNMVKPGRADAARIGLDLQAMMDNTKAGLISLCNFSRV